MLYELKDVGDENKGDFSPDSGDERDESRVGKGANYKAHESRSTAKSRSRRIADQTTTTEAAFVILGERAYEPTRDTAFPATG